MINILFIFTSPFTGQSAEAVLSSSCIIVLPPSDPYLKQITDEADLVLADVPCSGWGVLRRKPEIRYRDFGEGCGDLAALQGKILRAAASCS